MNENKQKYIMRYIATT